VTSTIKIPGSPTSAVIVICKILGVSADYILFGEMKEENITISKEQFEAINGLISMFGKEKL
jgi:hypothetical protein